ncbi:ATP-binding cassette domain-containing protein [Reinekea sp.]|jgi:sodium transport system ATP-binding protein|uniref:ABC transporter ATP-binding protein n=1 Tax=Reinekea sp. TaxID=1970455 RepID=UPI00398A051B
MLTLHSVSKSYGQFNALSNLSLQAEDSKITGILGPNGAGKTSALRILYGLLSADTGTAMIDNINVSTDALLARQCIGLFPDKFADYERLTAREQIIFFAKLHGLRGRDLKQKVNSVINTLQMQDYAERKSVGFSQGQRMKLTLAQALIHQPKNLILDEPTRGLDVMSTRLLRDHLRTLKDQGHCILFSSHVMQEVAALCDSVYLLAKGKIVAHGSPEELCEQTGEENFEDAFVKLIGSDEGIAA